MPTYIVTMWLDIDADDYETAENIASLATLKTERALDVDYISWDIERERDDV